MLCIGHASRITFELTHLRVKQRFEEDHNDCKSAWRYSTSRTDVPCIDFLYDECLKCNLQKIAEFVIADGPPKLPPRKSKAAPKEVIQTVVEKMCLDHAIKIRDAQR